MKKHVSILLGLLVLFSSLFTSCNEEELDPNICKITVKSEGNGTVSITDYIGTSVNVLIGNSVEVVATPDDGCAFIGWYISGTETPVSTDAAFTFTTSESVTLTARFAQSTVTHKVTIRSNGYGFVTFKESSQTDVFASMNILSGDEVTILAIPDVNAEFLGWFTTESDTSICAEREYAFVVNNSIELVAKFRNIVNENSNTNSATYATRIEIPRIENGDIFLSHTTIVNGKENITYSIAHNPTRKHCRWTAFTFDSSNRGINWQRDNWDNTEWGGDPFQPTPDMPESYVMTKDEVNRNGFVRGHIVASYDRVYSKDANEQTFYYSNISPMYYDFNIGAWSDCEGLVQGWGRNSGFCDTLYVVKGGTIREGEYRTVGSCPTVPNHYYMALLCLKNNTYKAIGLLFEHEDGYSQTQVCSIDYLEGFTGIDFFCNIPDKVEETVERQCVPSLWNGLKNYTTAGE